MAPTLQPEDVVDAVQRAGGYISVAAQILGVSRQTVYNYRDKHPEVAEAIEEAREHDLDVDEIELGKFARGQIEGQTTRERLTALMFRLEKRGRSRGYGKHIEVDGRVAQQQVPADLDLSDFLPSPAQP